MSCTDSSPCFSSVLRWVHSPVCQNGTKEVGVLGPPDFDRVFDESSVKLLRLYKVPLMSGKGRIVTATNPVVVKDSSGNRIGYATVYAQDADLFADLFINYSIPERLDLENGEPVFATPQVSWGKVIEVVAVIFEKHSSH